MTWVRVLVALPLGLAFGSFLTIAIHRVPAGESVVRPRSRCPSCGTNVRAVDTVPIVSWVALRGRCRTCGARISVAYPLTELATGALFVTTALVFEDLWATALLAPFLGLLFALSVIDIRHHKIPNRLVYPAILLSSAWVLVADLAGSELSAPSAGIGFLAYGVGLLIVALISPRGMGMGDVKLAALVGLVLGSLGLDHVAVAAGLGILFGGVGAIVALVAGAGRKTPIPFGPYLAAGAVVATFVGGQIADAYLSLIS
ncbi:MAG TPA: prepilin peptidase [Actinomycetota bacterium]|jgi:leader peptidase (prepilin peptidase)/N-methyltransferase|nr:prepilin peptidase [Actinomycetota bacterium]